MAEVTTIKIRGEDKSAAAFRSANRGIDRLERNLQAASAKTAALSGGLAKMGGIMAGFIGVGALGSFTTSIIQLGDRLQKVSVQTGLTVEEIEILQFAASQAGVGTDQLNSALQKFSINVGKAADGIALQSDAFKDLNIELKDSGGKLKDSSSLFVEVAESIAKIEEPAVKARIASDLFGKTGVELLALLNTGAIGIGEFAQRLREAGGIMGTTASDEFSAFNDQMDLLSRSVRGKVAPVLVAILPALTALAENLDEIAKFAAVVGTAFIVAKIPAMFAAITLAVKGLTLAMAMNPLGLIATGLAAIAVYKGDEIAEAFGFAEEAPEDLEKTNTKLEDTAKQLKALDDIEKTRVETSKKFVKTTKNKVVPSLKKLEEGLGETKIRFTSLMGPEGLGGVQLAFITFLGNLQTNALFYLGATEGVVNKFFAFVKQDFDEFFKALDNIVVFEGKKVRDSFSDILITMKKGLDALNLDIGELKIDVPGRVFTFRNTFIDVPGNIFNLDSSSLVTASNRIAAITSQVDGIKSYQSKRTSRNYNYSGTREKGTGRPYYLRDENTATTFEATALTGGENTASRSMSRSASSPAATNASSGSGSSIQINIFDGTGEAISQYDTNLRIEVKDVTSRQGTLPPIRVS